jgi:uncharacterized membrane protein
VSAQARDCLCSGSRWFLTPWQVAALIGWDTTAGHALISALAAGSVVASWPAIHALFALRYARLYYAEGGGIDFRDDRLADYGDFAYVAFTLGMTYEVSDTDSKSKGIRMTALRHALLSYLFGTVVVAMTINVVAGLLSK